MTNSEDGGPSRPQQRIDVNELFIAEDAPRRRRHARVAAATATLVAGGVVAGGFLVGGEDRRPAVDGTGSAAPTSGSTDSQGSESAATDPGLPAPTTTPTMSSDPGETAGSGSGAVPQSGSASGDQPTQEGHPSTAAPAQPAHHVVQAGDSLWSITAAALGGNASPDEILDNWPKIYEANRDVIGGDPNVIHPGQQLVIPPLG